MIPAPRDDDRAGGARAVFTRPQRLLLLLGFALLVALRLPQAWAHGRFLDEEATVFLAYAWHRSWLDALFRPFGGYWNLAANAVTLLVGQTVRGGVVPLERAPYLTMTAALLVQLLPGVLILTGRAAWLGTRTAVVAALLLVTTAPGTEEVFLNVLHIQFHLALSAALILAMDVPGGRPARLGYALLLALAPLCGPGAIVLVPLFGLRALVDRDPGRLAQCVALAAGAAVQLLLFYGASPVRGHLRDPATVAAMMAVRLVVLPLFNYGNAIQAGGAVAASQAAGGHGWWGAAAAGALLFAALLVAAARRRDAALWLALSALAIAAASFAFGMVVVRRSDLFGVDAGQRYQFLPLVLLGCALIALAERRTRARPVWAGLVLLTLLSGAIRYPAPAPDFSIGPSWPAEVAAWRRDHAHPLRVWPARWTADLSDTARACTPPDEPRYCEGGWAASFAHPPSAR